jgi:hypothetical protein
LVLILQYSFSNNGPWMHLNIFLSHVFNLIISASVKDRASQELHISVRHLCV